MNADGTRERQLTDNSIPDEHPAWSPDGTKIAFQRDHPEIFHSDLKDKQVSLPRIHTYVMRSDGSNPERLTNTSDNDVHPEWSPDGTRIAFVCDFNICTVDWRSRRVTRLTAGRHSDNWPDWSPDGSRLAFFRAAPVDENGIYVMSTRGGGITRITEGPQLYGYGPAWSPDGKLIAVVTSPSGPHSRIYVVKPDGSALMALTHGPHTDTAPDWKPSQVE
jgi:TolB protein